MKIALPWSLPVFFALLLPICASCTGENPRANGVGGDLTTTAGTVEADAEHTQPDAEVLPGIYSIPTIVRLLGNRKVGITTNHTGMIGHVHLVDTLLASGVNVVSVFAPEHGFRGDRPDGERIEAFRDERTGLPIHSLYGATKKPTPAHMKDVEIMLFDIQDVGARFYTYLSTLHYVMEAAAEKNIPVVVLDRPNPNLQCVDGPVLDLNYASFVGMHPVPVAYGMTIGEYARMINGEGWLSNGVKADLHVVPCIGYDRNTAYDPPIAPSPNLPDARSVHLYPSLCFFEGTTVSVGRGTPHPFSVIGEPTNEKGDFTFTPVPVPGASMNPKHEGVECRGYDLRMEVTPTKTLKHLDISWLVKMYEETADREKFFDRPDFFDLLAGGNSLRLAIIAGKSEEEIRAMWRKDLEDFAGIRAKYLIYP